MRNSSYDKRAYHYNPNDDWDKDGYAEDGEAYAEKDFISDDFITKMNTDDWHRFTESVPDVDPSYGDEWDVDCDIAGDGDDGDESDDDNPFDAPYIDVKAPGKKELYDALIQLDVIRMEVDKIEKMLLNLVVEQEDENLLF